MIDVLAIGAVSPLGIGEAAWSIDRETTCIAIDARLRDAGLKRPFAARAPIEAAGDPATALLLAAFAQIEAKVPRDVRLGVAIGTSSGGMATSESFFQTRDPALADGATYHAPFRALLARLSDRRVVRATHPVTACSASTLAIGVAMRWLELGDVDLAIAGGYDALTVFVAAGFEALGATTASIPPKPFRVGRDGMSLGEGAGLFLLARAGERSNALARLAGFGAAGDAVHLTAPDRTGSGIARAARSALFDLAPSIDLVSVHGTSTPFNDPMEAKGVAAALGRSIGDVEVHAAKATIGHTLGAAGVLESALAIDALRKQLVPATPGEGDLDPEVGARPRTRAHPRPLRAVLKLSAAFGGANAALAIVPSSFSRATAPSMRRDVREIARAAIDAETGDALDEIAAATGVAKERLARMDHVCRLALFAVSRLPREALRGAGIVLGTVLATIDVNASYDAAFRKKGAAHAEGRKFAYTTPNAAAGECSIAFGLTGPNLAVSRGIDAGREAEEVARTLLEAGDAERMVVVEVDARGPAADEVVGATGWPVSFGAVARLLERA